MRKGGEEWGRSPGTYDAGGGRLGGSGVSVFDSAGWSPQDSFNPEGEEDGEVVVSGGGVEGRGEGRAGRERCPTISKVRPGTTPFPRRPK